MRRLLVVHTGGVGDFVCTFPTLEVLSRSYDIEVAGIPERVALARAAGLAQAVHDLDHVGFSSIFSEASPQFTTFAQSFDEALVWMADSDGLIERNMVTAGVGRVRCFPGIPPQDWHAPAAQWYGTCAGVTVDLPYQARFPGRRSALEVVIQPGSGSRSKNWPLPCFEALAESLTQSGYRVSWCGGPAEEDFATRAASLPPMPLSLLAAELAGARLYVGNDSGISHLAAAAGCPTIALFGPTNPTVWRPVGPRVQVLTGAPWPDVSAVLAVAEALLGG